MGKNDFKDYLCRPYCMYFKEGQKEEMACQGAQVTQLLVRNKQLDAKKIQDVVRDPRLWKKHKKTLGKYICRQCPFQAEDCDFQSPTPSEDPEPCGGFIVLSFLKENNQIDERALETL